MIGCDETGFTSAEFICNTKGLDDATEAEYAEGATCQVIISLLGPVVSKHRRFVRPQ